MRKLKYCTSIVALALLAPVVVDASGSYTSRAPRPPAITRRDMAKDEKAKYEEGKRIFSGKTRLSKQSSVNAAEQETKLRELQSHLPASIHNSTDLPSLAGKLTPEQMDALEYYVNKRYPLK